jgi:hypothetical protein
LKNDPVRGFNSVRELNLDGFHAELWMGHKDNVPVFEVTEKRNGEPVEPTGAVSGSEHGAIENLREMMKAHYRPAIGLNPRDTNTSRARAPSISSA